MLRIYCMLKAQYLKTEMEYTFNFWMMVTAGILMRTLMLGVAYVMFQNVPTIAGFVEGEVYLIMAFMFLSEGMCNIVFDGIWSIPMMVHDGQFDLLLTRPVSPLFQILSHGIGLQGVGVVAMGVVNLVLALGSLGWTSIALLPACLIFVATGTVLRMSSYLIASSYVFYMEVGAYHNLPFVVYSVGEYAKYPISVYPVWMRAILLVLIPYAFIGYVPLLILRGDQPVMWCVLLAAATALFFLLARAVFYRGIRRYESMGM